MDASYLNQLFLSIFFFAPGIILFAGLAFVGLLMVLEKTVFAGKKLPGTSPLPLPLDQLQVANPRPGPIVASLKAANAPAAEAEPKLRRVNGDRRPQ